jgi:hypothetical protein
MSGARGGKQQKLYARAGTYPYDEPVTYGTPHVTGPDSVGGNPGSEHGITPMNTAHSPWDEIEEAMGTPYFFSKAYQGSQMGGATGVPGAAGSWSSGQGEWNTNEMPNDELDKYGNELDSYADILDKHDESYNPVSLSTERVPGDDAIKNQDSEEDVNLDADFAPKKLDRDFAIRSQNHDVVDDGNFPSDIMTFGSSNSFSQGLGKTYRLFRGTGGMVPESQIWKMLSRLAEKI